MGIFASTFNAGTFSFCSSRTYHNDNCATRRLLKWSGLHVVTCYNVPLFSHFSTLHFHYSTQLLLDFLHFSLILSDTLSRQVARVVWERNRTSGSEGHAHAGNPNLLHIQTFSSLPFCPCRPGTCVTYNWFINNASRCSWSSLESCQHASKLFYRHTLTDSPSLNAYWHRIEESNVFLWSLIGWRVKHHYIGYSIFIIQYTHERVRERCKLPTK